MHRITTIIDLNDPAAAIDGSQVQHVHLVQILDDTGMFAVLTMPHQAAAMLPRGRLSLHDTKGAQALEGFRRWLKQQDVPLSRVGLRFARREDYARLISDGVFSSGTFIAHEDALIAGRFSDWLGAKTLTPLAVRSI